MTPTIFQPQTNKSLAPAAIFFNRELSWLKFNERVLEEAINSGTKDLERIKFVDIFCRNLDEFFMVRVAGLKRSMSENLANTDSPDQLLPAAVMAEVAKVTTDQVNRLYSVCYQDILPRLRNFHVSIHSYNDLDDGHKRDLTEYFYRSVFPVLTPLAVDPAHPFPFLGNLKLYLLIVFNSNIDQIQNPPIALVEIPEVLPRLIQIQIAGTEGYDFVLLEDLVARHLDSLFLGYYIKDVTSIRVTRDLDFTLLENDVVDLLKSVQKGVKDREQARAVRLEIEGNTSPTIINILKNKLVLNDNDIYKVPGPINLCGLSSLYDLPIAEAKDLNFNPRLPPRLKSSKDMFALVAERDLLIHHPYESFYAVIEFLNNAAADPDVLAIKQTLYRTSGDSPVINALIRAAENGKQVTAVVELKARFDERNNISWAREMERSGVNVVYGFIGLKTHGKATLVVRREGEVMQRYVHLSTGNYNSATAKFYVDLGLITANVEIGHDISTFFNLLTGFNIFNHENGISSWVIPEFKRITIAPLNLKTKILELINTEIQNARAGLQAAIIGKMNALVDPDIILKLYEASQAGVSINLIVRGICCLKPGLKNLSENIRVIAIVDRFLEHSRIYYFLNGGIEKIFLSSADWMPRNMIRRVELLYPVLDPICHQRIKEEILDTYLADNVKARHLASDGNYYPRAREPGDPLVQAQSKFIEIARESGLKSMPYDKAIHHGHRKGTDRPVFNKQSTKTIVNLKGKKP